MTSAHSARRRLGAAWRGLVLLIVFAVGLTAMSTFETPGIAQADESPQWCLVDGRLSPWTPSCGEWQPPPIFNQDLLNGDGPMGHLYKASAQMQENIRRGEAEAVNGVLQRHGLPASDAAAVLTWARNDVIAELWDRMPRTLTFWDRWMMEVHRRYMLEVAGQVGREYVRWAGSLVPPDYEQGLAELGQYKERYARRNKYGKVIVPEREIPDSIQNALDRLPLPNGSAGGYCVYKPPAGYESEYTASHPACSPAGCFFCPPPPYPSFENLVRWASARTYETLGLWNDREALAVSSAVLGGLIAVGYVGAITMAIGTALYASGMIINLGKLIYPFAQLDVLGVAGAIRPDAYATMATVYAGASIIIIIAIAIAVAAAIQLDEGESMPRKVADLIYDVYVKRTKILDDLLADPNDKAWLFLMFVGATLPEPTPTRCDNRFTVSGPGRIEPPCLNATPIPAPRADDPRFEVTRHGSSESTIEQTLDFRIDGAASTGTVRMSGNWFVQRVTTTQGPLPETQGLHLAYTDWDGKSRRVWMRPAATGGFEFVDSRLPDAEELALDESVCKENPAADDRCPVVKQSIQMVTTSGEKVSVRVVPALAPPAPPPVPDETAPTVSITEVQSPRPEPVRSLQVEFSEPVVGRPTFSLTHDGVPVDPLVCTGCLVGESLPPLRWIEVPLVDTSADGEWAFTVSTAGMTDRAGNPFAEDVHTRRWVMDEDMWAQWPARAAFDPLPKSPNGFTENAPLYPAPPVDSVTLRFTKPVTGVDVADFRLQRKRAKQPGVSFEWEDVALTGATLSGSGTTYVLSGLAGKTSSEWNDQYWLTLVGDGGIVDAQGQPPLPERSISSDLATLSFAYAYPTASIDPVGAVHTSAPEVVVRFSEPVVPQVTLFRDGELVDASGVTVTAEGPAVEHRGNSFARVYRLSGLPDEDGDYELRVNARDRDDASMADWVTASWAVNSAAPRLEAFLDPDLKPIEPDGSGGFEALVVKFSEPVTGVDVGDFALYRDGELLSLAGVELTGSGHTYQLSGLLGLTSPDTKTTSGYELKLVDVRQSGIRDLHGAGLSPDPVTGDSPSLRFFVDGGPLTMTVHNPGPYRKPEAFQGVELIEFSKPVVGFPRVRLERDGELVWERDATDGWRVFVPPRPRAWFGVTGDFFPPFPGTPGNYTMTVSAGSVTGFAGDPVTNGPVAVSYTIVEPLTVDVGPAARLVTEPMAEVPVRFNRPVYLDREDVTVTRDGHQVTLGDDVSVRPADPEHAEGEPATSWIVTGLDTLQRHQWGFFDGEYRVAVGSSSEIRDLHDLSWSVSGQTEFALDTTPPEAYFNTRSRPGRGDNDEYLGDVEVKVSGFDQVSGVAEVRCAVDPEEVPVRFEDLPADPCRDEWFVVTGDGEHAVYAAALDVADHTSRMAVSRFVIDTTAPQVSITPDRPDGDDGWWVSPVDVVVSSDDASASVRCVVDPDPQPAGFDQLPASCAIDRIEGDGVHTVMAGAKDPAGHTSSVISRQFKIDRTDPTVSLALVSTADRGDNGAYLGDVAVAATAADSLSGVAGVRCVIDPVTVPRGFADLEGDGCTGAVSGNGVHRVYAASRDVAGNTSGMAVVSFRIDTTAPVATIRLDPATPDGAQGWYVDPVTVTVSGSEPGVVRCALDPKVAPVRFADLPARRCARLTVSSFGRHVVYAAVQDRAGRISRVVAKRFRHIGRFRCRGIPATHVGTAGRDRIVGTVGDDVIVALGGGDTITGRGGDDVICAGAGRDLVFGQGGDDQLAGGAGGDIVDGGGGNDRVFGQAGNDLVVGASGDDTVSGGAGHDRLFGGRGNDTIVGGPGNDLLAGGPGSNTIRDRIGHNRTLTPTTGPH